MAATHLLPGVAVYGVEPEAGNDTQLSLQRGEIVHIDTPRTIADGAQTQSSGQLTFPVIQALVKGVLTVSDAQLVETMRFFAARMKLVVEPTGCLGAAALLEGAIDLRGAARRRHRQRWQCRPGALRRAAARRRVVQSPRLRARTASRRASTAAAPTLALNSRLRACSSGMPSPKGRAKPSSMIDL